MANFPGQNDGLDAFAFRAAVEAVVGLSLRGEEVNTENVDAWLLTALDPETRAQVDSRQIYGRAKYFTQRMLNGPFKPDGSAPEIPPLLTTSPHQGPRTSDEASAQAQS